MSFFNGTLKGHIVDFPGTYQVFVEYDGCINDPVSFEGTHVQCIAFMRLRRAPKLCNWSLVNKETRRCVSYML